MITPQQIKDWLPRQTGYEYQARPDTIQIIRDPQVPGTFAAQFEDARDGQTIQLLFITAGETGTADEILDRTLEETEFTTWPPTSGNLNFFA